jgi:hypothetical protein
MKRHKFLSNKLPVYLLTLFLGGWFVIQVFTGSDKKYQESDTNTIISEPNYSVKQPTIPKELNFANEQVPLDLFDVYESVDREFVVNSYWHSSTIQTIKRAKRFFPVIEPILAENNIPDDFKYLCVIESNLKNATSPAGAKGFWQFMKTTGKEYGLEINSYVDERYNLEKSTKAACTYLQKAYDKFGSWTLAAASYNMGTSGLQKKLNQQQVDNYYDLLLNPETARYVYRILAVKNIMPNHEEYGFKINEDTKYAPFETQEIIIDTTITNLVNFAFSQGINYKILKKFNPWLLSDYLTNNSGKEYTILLPKNGLRPCKIPEKYKN